MKKIVPLVFHFLFCFPFILFLYFAGIENYENWRKLAFILTISMLLFIGIGQPKFYKNNFETDQLQVIPFVLIGTLLTYFIQDQLHFNPLLSAGIVGVSAALIEKKIKSVIALPIYCGVFVGMTNVDHHIPYPIMATIGLVAGVVYYWSKNFYSGIGGKLGTIAFTSVLASVIILKYLVHDFYN